MAPLIPIAISLAAKYVPEIIEHFSGKNAAGVAGKVLEVAQAVTGSPNPDEAVKGLSANPELALKFKQAVLDQEAELKRLALEEVKAFLADGASARDREVKVSTSSEAPYLNKIIVPCLAIGILGLSFSLFGVLLFVKVDPAHKDILIYILGVLSAICTQVTAYYFGSSAGSTAKDQTLKRMMTSQ